MQVSEILDTKGASVVTVRATAPLSKAITLLDQERIGALPVVNENGHLAGMLSERDLVSVLAEYRDRALKANVGALMSEHVYICTPEDTLEDALAWMVSYRVRHLPVVADNQVQGLISIGDVAKHLVGEASTEPHTLEDGVTAA